MKTMEERKDGIRVYNPNQEKVTKFVDVYPWLVDIYKRNRVTVEGIYRFADALICADLCPAIVSETLSPDPKLIAAFNMLQKAFSHDLQMFEFTSVTALFDYANARVSDTGELTTWMSFALDSTCPRLLESASFTKTGPIRFCAIVHDLMAVKGYFGASNIKQFDVGLKTNACLIPNSYVTKLGIHDYIQSGTSVELPVFAPCFTKLQKLEHQQPPFVESYSITTIATAYPRKQVSESFKLLCAFLDKRGSKPYKCQHVGDLRDEGKLEALSKDFSDSVFLWGTISDDVVSSILTNETNIYMQMSECEGFSMTPMEALFHGVSNFILSDIPVHREIYGNLGSLYGVNVVFLPKNLDFKKRDSDCLSAFFDRVDYDHKPHPSLNHWLDFFTKDSFIQRVKQILNENQKRKKANS